MASTQLKEQKMLTAFPLPWLRCSCKTWQAGIHISKTACIVPLRYLCSLDSWQIKANTSGKQVRLPFACLQRHKFPTTAQEVQAVTLGWMGVDHSHAKASAYLRHLNKRLDPILWDVHAAPGEPSHLRHLNKTLDPILWDAHAAPGEPSHNSCASLIF